MELSLMTLTTLKRLAVSASGFAVALATLALCSQAKAAQYFVRETAAETGIELSDAHAATVLVKNLIANRAADSLGQTESTADYVLQPRLLKLGDVYLLTIEKSRTGEILYAAQTKFRDMANLDIATGRAVELAFNEAEATSNVAHNSSGSRRNSEAGPSAPYAESDMVARVDSGRSGATAVRDLPMSDEQGRENSRSARAAARPAGSARMLAQQDSTVRPYGSGSGTTSGTSSGDTGAGPSAATQPSAAARTEAATTPSVASSIANKFPDRKMGYWNLGVGPVFPRKLESDHLMYGVSGGYVWDLQPQISIKALAEAAFTSANDGAQFTDVGLGANYYFLNSLESAPYLTADMGYGYAKSDTAGSAEGFSLGLGAGYQFFRTTERTLDILVRFTTIMNGLSRTGGNPSALGARFAVNF
jgi:hypothetical protein